MKSHQLFFYQYRTMYRPYINKLNLYLAKHQLYSSQWSILYLLIHEGPFTLVEMANFLNVEKPTITRMIQKLVELNYVETVPGKDKREKRIHLTDIGEQVCSEVQATIDQFQKEALQGISEEDQLLVSRILATVQENLLK